MSTGGRTYGLRAGSLAAAMERNAGAALPRAPSHLDALAAEDWQACIYPGQGVWVAGPDGDVAVIYGPIAKREARALVIAALPGLIAAARAVCAAADAQSLDAARAALGAALDAAENPPLPIPEREPSGKEPAE